MIYRDTKDRKEESLKAQDSPVEVQKTMQQNYRSSSDDDPNKDNDQELTTGEGKSGGNSGAGKSGGEDMGSEKPTMDERMGSRKHEGGNQEDEDGGKKDEPGK